MPGQEFTVTTISLDLPPLAGAFSRRLHDAGLPVGAERAERFARALTLGRPIARHRLYWIARAVFVTAHWQVESFDAVFTEVFGAPAPQELPLPDAARQSATAPDHRPSLRRPQEVPAAPGDQPGSAGMSSPAPSQGDEIAEREVPVATVASAEELIRAKRFDALSAAELAAVYRLMSELALATPRRRTRRSRRGRHGTRIDMRRTLRASLRTGGDPIRLARRRRRIVSRRLVLLCDISGSMEPYARAYLQFLTCAVGIGSRPPSTEAFAFATRLTRLSRALHSRNPDVAIAQAAATAPDWASGTRIGDALQSFNDLHGRRGMARGAVVVILSDGWERGDPSLVAREMERLSRLAYRIVWVNPRAAATGFSPKAGGMVAALPYCDALVSGHSLEGLEEVVQAIAAPRSRGDRAADEWSDARLRDAEEPEVEPWASATPVPGSSVAMPSGYGPSRGRTTPGWGLGR